MALERKTRAEAQQVLFETGDSWEELWWGMPEYVMGDARPLYRVTVNLFTVEDLVEFGRRLDMPITTRTDTITFPKENVDKPRDWVYTDET